MTAGRPRHARSQAEWSDEEECQGHYSSSSRGKGVLWCHVLL